MSLQKANKSIIELRSIIFSSSAKKDIIDLCENTPPTKIQSSKDVYAIDKSNSYKGVYHVLGGAISPTNGISPSDLSKESELSVVSSIILSSFK